MSEGTWRERLRVWVDGEREPRDRTLFVMESPQRTSSLPTPEEHEVRERHRLRKFLNWYPAAAVIICAALVAVLLAAVVRMPAFGEADNPINNEVSRHYLARTEEETGASNAVTGMILSYRGFDTLGESCVLFLAVASVTLLLRREDGEPEDAAQRRLRREDALQREHPDVILQQSARLLIPFILLFALYVLLNGESSPGGGFSGGTVLGGGLILYAAAFGFERLGRFFSRRAYSAVRTFGLLLYTFLYGCYIVTGANGLTSEALTRMGGLSLPIDLAVGLVVACTVYGFYALFARGEI